jgi:hypothetical protein
MRSSDLSHLALLQYPVRCRVCKQRGFVFLPQAWKIQRADVERHKQERAEKRAAHRTPAGMA